MANDWMKGGLRYKRLKKQVRERLAHEGLVSFFIGTAKPLSLARPGRLSHLAADEYVLAVTARAVHIIEMGGMGVFSARLDSTVAEIPIEEASAAWDSDAVVVDERAFHPFPYHDEDARAFVDAVSSASGPQAAPGPVPPA